MHHARRFAVVLFLVLTAVALAPPAARAAAGARWQGLPLWGGTVQVAASPRSPEIAYAATATDGVYRSRDGGRSWRLASLGPRGLPVEILGADPHDPRRLFAAGVDSTGLYRSDDEGSRWTRVDQGFGSPFVFAVDFDPVTPGRVYVATGGGQFRSGLYRSDDHGATWTPLAFPDNGLATVAVSPVAPRVLLASGFVTPGRVAILRSVDFGRTFVPVHDAFVRGFVFDPSRPRRVYGWREFSSDVLRSDDGGATWAALPTPFGVSGLAVTRSGLLLAGTSEGVRRSVDGGASWEPLPGSPAEAARAARPKDSIASFAVLADAVLAGGGRGVWRGGPDGSAWKAASDGVRAQQIGALAVAADDEATVWVVATGGFFQSRDAGATFRIRPARLGHLLAVHPLAPQTAYAFGVGGGGELGLLKTEDGGATWRLLPYTGVLDAAVLAVDPLDPDIVYAGGFLAQHASPCTALRSLDGGESWGCIAPPGTYAFVGLAIDPGDPRTLYALHFGSGSPLYRSGDRGETWSRLPARGLVSPEFLRHDPFVPGRLYAGGPAGVFRSDDRGRTWRQMSRGLPPGNRAHDLLADPARPDRLYAAIGTSAAVAGGDGVYRSDDAGRSWTKISAGLPGDAVVVRLAMDPRGADVLYAGTAGRSLYRLTVAD